MIRRHAWKFLSVLFLLPMFVVFVSAVAQQDDCPLLVQQALMDLGQNCNALDRNSACYGFNKLAATFNAEQPDNFFSKVSDRTPLNILDTLSTTPLDTTANTWGVAVMKVQANVPNSLPGQSVTFVLLGDAQIRNDVSPTDAFTPADPVDITIIGNVNIRSSASTKANVIASVTDGTVLPADGISENGNWYRVLYNDAPAWVSAQLVNAPDAAKTLPVWTRDLRTPMQAFYLTTGVSNTACNKAPDALMVQGPNTMKVDLTVNGADITIGSTVVFRSLESSYGDLLNDKLLVEQFGDLLTGHGSPGDLKCNVMQIMVIDGNAGLNDDGVHLPTGFTARSINCGGADRSSGFMTPWGGSRPLTQEELDFLDTFNNIPPKLLNYPIHVPSLGDIQKIIQTYSGGGGGVIPGPAANKVDCSKFKPTSPLGTMPSHNTTFYWDPAIGATSYTVKVYDSSGAVVGEYSVDAPLTYVSGDPGGQNNMSWEVVANFNGQVACTTARTNVIRDLIQVVSPGNSNSYNVCVPYVCPASCSIVGTCGYMGKDTLCSCSS
ncbi:MAG: SH3 domain-containing protein [Chloroflexota bacterium]